MQLHLHYEAVKHGWRDILDVIYVITQVENIIINPSFPFHPPTSFFGTTLKIWFLASLGPLHLNFTNKNVI